MCGSLTDIHEQVIVQESLERTRERELHAREEFARQLLVAHEQERLRIANELHDSIGQSLSLIANRARLALNIAQLPASASVHLESLAQVTAAAIGDVRALVQNLRPLHIDQIGLTASLEGLIERWAQSTDVKVIQRLENVDGQLSGTDARMSTGSPRRRSTISSSTPLRAASKCSSKTTCIAFGCWCSMTGAALMSPTGAPAAAAMG